MNRKIVDLIDAIPLGARDYKDDISGLLRIAYWRGVGHQKDDPEGTKAYMEEMINEIQNRQP